MEKIPMRDLVIEFDADRGSLNRFFRFPHSDARSERLNRLCADWIERLETVGEPAEPGDDQIDWVLLLNLCRREQADLLRSQTRRVALTGGWDFWKRAVGLIEARQMREFPNPMAVAETLAQIEKEVQTSGEHAEPGAASVILGSLLDGLADWHTFYAGYDPAWDWWVATPYAQAVAALEKLRSDLAAAANMAVGDEPPPQAPIGREGLMDQLKWELIPYSPEELVAIGDAEMAWCEAELARAAADLGLASNAAAIEHVKNLYPAVGGQAPYVKQLTEEAITFLEERDLLTVPELAKETWRMGMMSADRQLVNPFFLGGEQIIVSSPTASMSHERKLMSLRGNNRHFAKATVQHELIPGHHIQQFMCARFKPYREAFWTPFWVEGWTIYWEMRLWDEGFHTSPEDRIGMLFWRMHRSARITFSLKYHLGEMSAQECVDFLVERVGHERANAEGEVRRSFGGNYPELYQLAYMIGGVQVRALCREMQAQGWTLKQFHDAMIRENQMPIEALRACLQRRRLAGPGKPEWRFYDKS